MLYFQIILNNEIVYSSDDKGNYYNTDQEARDVADDVGKLHLQLDNFEVIVIPREELLLEKE